jgi:hypothetical protein
MDMRDTCAGRVIKTECGLRVPYPGDGERHSTN